MSDSERGFKEQTTELAFCSKIVNSSTKTATLIGADRRSIRTCSPSDATLPNKAPSFSDVCFPDNTKTIAKDSLDVLNLGTTTATPSQVITQMAQGVSVYDAYGRKISPRRDNVTDIGDHTLDFDMDTLQGRITPAFATEAMAMNNFGGSLFSYSGADCRAMIEVADTGLPRILQAGWVFEP
jgi:hypothetical protein